MITVRDVCFSYGKRTILDGLSFTAEPGECVVFAGHNGAGKSTALSVIAGILRPTHGTVEVQGRVGIVPQGTALFEDMTVGDNLRFFADLAGCAVPEELPFGVQRYGKTKVSRLSGGMKKQVSIACALLGDPRVLLLDEPCAALDVVYRTELIELISSLKKAGRTVIYVGHEPMEFAAFYDKLIFFGEKPVCRSRAQLSGDPAEDICLYARFTELFRTNDQRGETT